MRYEDIKVRADFVQDQIVPLGFQLSTESSFCNIKRILSVKKEGRAVEFQCTVSTGRSNIESPQTVCLRFDYANFPCWSATFISF